MAEGARGDVPAGTWVFRLEGGTWTWTIVDRSGVALVSSSRCFDRYAALLMHAMKHGYEASRPLVHRFEQE